MSPLGRIAARLREPRRQLPGYLSGDKPVKPPLVPQSFPSVQHCRTCRCPEQKSRPRQGFGQQ